MSILSAANLNTVIDNLSLGYAKALGTSGSGYGIGEPGGTYGTADAVGDAITALVATADADAIGDLLSGLSGMKSALSTLALYGAAFRPMLSRISAHARSRGGGLYTDLDSWLTYLNTGTGTKWQALQEGVAFRAIYNQAKGGSNYPAVCNCYFEVLQGSTYTNALRKSVVTGSGTDTETAGQSIDSTKYCGGFPQLRVSGLTGTGTITIAGTEYNPATKVATAGKTWTAAVSGNGVVALVVGTAAADSLIIACSAVTIPAGISAGTVYVEAARPSGRPLLS